MRTLFFVLWIIPALQAKAQGAVEIYANGHKYATLQSYQESKQPAAVRTPQTPVSINSQQENYIQQQAQKLGIHVDFSKVKTYQVNQESMSNTTLHRLYVLSVENGIVGALRDFYQDHGQSIFYGGHKVSSQQLQEAIQQAVTTSRGPKLFISQPGKVRIMAMSTDNSKR